MLLCFNAHAQTDITSTYLKNTGFDEEITFGKTYTEKVEKSINDVKGWIGTASGEFTTTGTFEYGTKATCAGNNIPSAGYGGSKGGCLAVKTGWGGKPTYYQNVDLPQGRYGLVVYYYNASANTKGASLCGWVPETGAGQLSNITKFSSKTWATDTIFFNVGNVTKGKLQVGYTGNGLSSSTATILFDAVKLLSYGIDKSDLQNRLTTCTTLYDEGNYAGCATVAETLKNGNSINDNPDATMAEISAIIDKLDIAIELTNQARSMQKLLKQANGYYGDGIIAASTTIGEAIDYATNVDKNGTATLDEIKTASSKLNSVMYLAKFSASFNTTIKTAQDLLNNAPGCATIELKEGIANAQKTQSNGKASETAIRNAKKTLQGVIDSYKNAATFLSNEIARAEKLLSSGIGNTQSELSASISNAKQTLSNESATNEETRLVLKQLQNAEMAYRLSAGKGNVPKVTTYPYIARGSDMALGRATVANESNMEEIGFCWSTDSVPTVYDNTTTQYLNNRGKIYWMKELTPSTIYYGRAYAISKSHMIGYGQTIKFATIPKGKMTYNIRSDASGDNRERITNAIDEGVEWYNHFVNAGYNIDAGYSASSATANGGYGGWIGFGPSAGYQKAGTALHEMAHTAGVGTTSVWTGSTELRAKGQAYWQGKHVNDVMHFLENSTNVGLYGDNTHMWAKDPTGQIKPLLYGVNGAHEEQNNVLQYIGNALIIEALGEDGMPLPNKKHSIPSFAFNSKDSVKYYIRNEHEGYGRNTSFLTIGKYNRLAWVAAAADSALVNDSMAWYINYQPTSCTYTLQNVATKRYISYSASGSNGIKPITKSKISDSELWQIQQGIKTVVIGDNGEFSSTSFYIQHPEAVSNQQSLTATSNGATSAEDYRINYSAGMSQRWLMLDSTELRAMDYAIQQLNNKEEIINYAKGWDAGDMTGEGSEPNKHGWAATPDVTWGQTNQKGCRYMDAGNGEYINYTFNGNACNSHRILWIRYNNSENITYTIPKLEPGRKYNVSFKYAWHNNGSAPTLSVGVFRKSNETELVSQQLSCSSSKREFKEAMATFETASEADTYYISFRSNINDDVLVALGDLLIVDADPETTDIKGINNNSSDANSIVVKRYDLSGRIVDNTYRGIVIEKMSNGSTRKRIIINK